MLNYPFSLGAVEGSPNTDSQNENLYLLESKDQNENPYLLKYPPKKAVNKEKT